MTAGEPSPAELYAPLDRSRLYEQVANKIETMIVSRHLKPRDRLPSERDLAESFAVSRTVIREAFKLLEARGLVEILTGNGVFVSHPDSSVVAKSLGMYLHLQVAVQDSEFKIHELRRLLEVEIAGLAAERATDTELEQLRQIVERMGLAALSREQVAMLDLEYHVTLAQATHNEMISLVYEPVIEYLRQQLIAAWQRYDRSPEVFNRQHRELYEAVRHHDPARARTAMTAHLDYARQLLDRFSSAASNASDSPE
jgi:GntR family transcriptional regulator, transcriptional repressor for pyruvate dehydrogenase complex